MVMSVGTGMPKMRAMHTPSQEHMIRRERRLGRSKGGQINMRVRTNHNIIGVRITVAPSETGTDSIGQVTPKAEAVKARANVALATIGETAAPVGLEIGAILATSSSKQ
jgi:hypothetical protein